MQAAPREGVLAADLITGPETPMRDIPHGAPRYSRGYLIWAMTLLFLVYTSNFIDRTLLSVLQQPIKEELKLSDAQLGVLGGFAFAALYSTLGIPLARLAERYSRKGIITVALVVWSAMTALCGTANSYGALFAFRVGVGVGEAGASPPAHSLIADYFPPRQRATALSIYSLGIPIGVLAGSCSAASSPSATAGGRPSWWWACRGCCWRC